MNDLLQTEKPVPFEFLINGQFLRTTIDEFLTQNGISSETTLDVEYVRALIPPLHVASFEHDDWVSTVDALTDSSPAGASSDSDSSRRGQERILSGSYDGLLRVWNTSSEILATSKLPQTGGRIASIKAAKFVSPSKIVSGGLDMTVRLWDYVDSEDPDSMSTASLRLKLELYGHNWGVESLAVNKSGSRILSASSDHQIGLWSTKASEMPAAPPDLLASSSTASNKRLKTSKSAESNQALQRGPLHMFAGHSGPVSSVTFAPSDNTIAYTVSHDHTLRTWDLPTLSLVDTRTTSHPLLSLAAMDDVNLLAAGTSARHITLFDPRTSATKIAALTLRGHTNAVVSLARNPDSSYGLASGSHDGTCKVWDIRSVKAGSTELGGGQVGESVYNIARESSKGKKHPAGESSKVFSVCWDRDLGILSAGEDKKVQINKAYSVIS